MQVVSASQVLQFTIVFVKHLSPLLTRQASFKNRNQIKLKPVPQALIQYFPSVFNKLLALISSQVLELRL